MIETDGTTGVRGTAESSDKDVSTVKLRTTDVAGEKFLSYNLRNDFEKGRY